MIAIPNAHTFDPSCSNLLMVAHQNAHAFRPNSIVAKKRLPRSLVGAMTKMMTASGQDSVQHRFSASSVNSSALSFSAFHFSDVLDPIVLERFLTNGREDRKVPGQICWSQPEITVLEFQDSSGEADVIILRCHHGICGGIRFLALEKHLPFFSLG